MASLTLSRLSRYKDTPAFDAGGEVEFGLWEKPAEFTDLPTGARLHTVRSNEIGMLDMIAVIYFGDGYEEMWWAIAEANGIINPETEMYPGMKLVIPPDSRKAGFVGRGGLTNGAA